MAERRDLGDGLPGGSRVAGEGATGPRLRLGEWLRTTRLRRGFSLAEIERDTRINRLYLEALEEEHYDVLPAPVYTRGFLRSYARALGLDPAEAVAMLPSDLPQPPGLDPLPAMRGTTHDAPALSLPSLPQLGFPALNLERRPGLLRWGAGVFGALALLAAAWFGSGLLTGTAAPTGTSGTSGATGSTPGVPGTTGTTGTPAAVAPVAGDIAPNFVGVQQEAAQRVLQERGVTWVTVGIAHERPAGEIVGQTPSADAPLKRGDHMTLVVSRGAAR